MFQRYCLLLLAIGASFILASSASAAIFRVDTAADTGDADLTDGFCDDGTGFCTLRAAIEQANANEVTDYVILGETTYFLTDGPLVISSSVRVLGKGTKVSIIDGNNTSTVLEINPAEPTTRVKIKNVTLTHGNGLGGGAGISGGRVTLEQCAISENVGRIIGGGLFVSGGRVTIDRCEVLNNRQIGDGFIFGGGGILAINSLVKIKDSVVSGNVSEIGGGILNVGVMTIDRSIIEENTVTGGFAWGAGGIYNQGWLSIRDSAIRLNEANSNGGGISNLGRMILKDSRVENNSATNDIGGGIYSETAVRLPGTIISGNSPDQCAGTGSFRPPCP